MADVIGLLAPALGRERAEEIVSDAARRLGMMADPMSHDDAVRLLTELAGLPGLGGLAARFARERLAAGAGKLALKPSVPPPAPSRTPRTPRPKSQSETPTDSKRPIKLARGDVVELLSRTLGREKSEELVNATADELRLPAGDLDKDQALSILERLATGPGLLGITARFAKAKLILKN